MNPRTPISSPAAALLQTLTRLVTTQTELRDVLSQQAAAMRGLDVATMATASRRQETLHRSLLRLEAERRKQAKLCARARGLGSDATLVTIANAFADERDALLAKRLELREVTTVTRDLGQACSRLAGGVLAHLNQALRIVHKPWIYSSTGEPPLQPGLARRVRTSG